MIFELETDIIIVYNISYHLIGVEWARKLTLFEILIISKRVWKLKITNTSDKPDNVHLLG